MKSNIPGPVAQSVARLIADPGVLSMIQDQYHTFVEIDHGIFSTVSLFQQLIHERLLSVKSESMCTKYWIAASSSLPRKMYG